MSWSLELVNPDTHEVVEVPEKHNMFGCNVRVGGEDRLRLDVTYNYGREYRKVGFDIRSIYGKTGRDAIPMLKKAIADLESLDNDKETEEILNERKAARKRLEEDIKNGLCSSDILKLVDDGTDVESYWFPSPVHAKAALDNLVKLSEMALDGVWEGD